MKKVGLLLAIEPTAGGSFQYNQMMLEALCALPNHSYEIVVGYSHTAWKPYLKDLHCSTIYIPFGFWGRIWAQLLRYTKCSLVLWRRLSVYLHPSVKAFIAARCDIWIFPSQDPWSYLVPIPNLVSIHDLMHRYEKRFPEVGNPREYAWREWHYSNICQYSSGILVDSNVGRDQVVESYHSDPSKVGVLPFSVPPYLHTSASDDEITLARLNIPKKYIFYPAQFWEHKNHKRLLRAVADLKYRTPDIKLVLAGAPKNAYNTIMQLLHELHLEDQIVVLGYVTDHAMPTLYRYARALVMPTFFGPTNIPPLEAMTLGCPVAVSNIYGMAEQTDGAALLFDPESVSEIAEVIYRLWVDDELCKQLSEKGLRVVGQWTKEDFINRFEEILTTLSNKIK